MRVPFRVDNRNTQQQLKASATPLVLLAEQRERPYLGPVRPLYWSESAHSFPLWVPVTALPHVAQLPGKKKKENTYNNNIDKDIDHFLIYLH